MSETSSHPVCDSTSLAVCGDSVAGRALALLLQGVGCAAKFVPSTALDRPDSLAGVEVILLRLTPELSVHHRETLTKKLQNAAELHRIPIIQLAAVSETRQEKVPDKTQYTLAWPCSTEEILQSIATAQTRLCNGKK